MKSRIAILLDRSSSMASIREEAIAAFNEQVNTLKKMSKEIDTKVSLFTFASKADAPKVWNEPIESLKPITAEDYVPEGMTSMYDSVGMAINLLNGLPEASDGDTSFLVVIISDGEENNSKSFTSPVIAAQVQALQNTKAWTFTYMGANQDLTKVQQRLGLYAGNTITFNATSKGMATGSAFTTAGIQQYCSNVASGNASMTNFYSGDTTTGGAQGQITTGQSGTLQVKN